MKPDYSDSLYPFHQITFLEGVWVITANNLWSLIGGGLE